MQGASGLKFRALCGFVLAAFCVLSARWPAAAAASPYGLAFGPYGAGVRTYVVRDYSRGWQTLSGPIGYRPLLVRLWYPSAAPGAMPFGDYLKPVPAPPEVRRAVEGQLTYSADSLKKAVGDATSYARLLRTTVPAARDARPAGGFFPVVLYGLGQADHIAENTVIGEYLASHGYLVVTTAQFATNERRNTLFIDDPYSYDTQVRDLETALAQIPAAYHPDRSRLAFIGMSMGGIYTLLAAMQHPAVRALVGLDPTYVAKRAGYEYDQKKLPYYDPASVKAPLLVLYRQEDQHTFDDVLALTRSDRYLAEIPHAIHGDFTSFPWLTETIPASSLDAYAAARRTQSDAMATFRFYHATVLDFLDDKVLGRTHFALSTTPRAIVRHEVAIRAPSEEDLANILVARGYPAAENDLKTAMEANPSTDIVRFKVLNRIGFEFLYSNRAALAVDAFRLNVVAHPALADAFESLGEGYVALKDRTNAEAAFKRALTLDPANRDALSELEKLSKMEQPPMTGGLH